MLKSPSQSLPEDLEASDPVASLSDLLTGQPRIAELDQFLAEQNDDDALREWIVHFIPPRLATNAESVKSVLTRHIAEIDRLIDMQVNEIIHQPAFQKLEASWRGLWYLVEQADGTQNIKIRVLDIDWSEIVKDIGRALEFDQSQLFHKIYSEEYGTPGGEPFGVLIGDYEVSHQVSAHHPHDDVSTLAGMAQIAAASFAPFIASISSHFFGLDDFAGLGQPISFANILVQDEYSRWRSLRNNPDSRFLGLTLPHILLRRPYSEGSGNHQGVYFNERTAGADSRKYLWGSASYAFAGILIREFANIGWFGHIRGVPRGYLAGGLVTTLAADEFHTDSEGLVFKPLTDVIITDSAEKELSELGFIPLCQCYNSPYAAFYNNQSVQLPKTYGSQDAQINAKLSAMLQHIFCGSRIAHYLKIIFRDKVGSFLTADACERYLRTWLETYTAGRDDEEWETQARYPLRAADVNVREHPMHPGKYLCEIRLQPHYQLDNMTSELELVTELTSIS